MIDSENIHARNYSLGRRREKETASESNGNLLNGQTVVYSSRFEREREKNEQMMMDMNIDSDGTAFICPECSFNGSSLPELISHLNEAHGEGL